MSVAAVPAANPAAVANPALPLRSDPSQPPPFVLELYIHAHQAASQALAVLQTVMQTALQAPTEKLPPALNHARLAAGQVLRFASKLLAPSEPRAPRAPRSPRSATPPAPPVPAAPLPAQPPGPAAKTVPPLPQPAHSPLSALLNNLMGRTADAPARPAPPTPPPGSTVPVGRSR